MSEHPDPVGAYRQLVAEHGRSNQILAAARRCPHLSVDEAMPALLALTDYHERNLYQRTVERWIERYRREFDPMPSDGELALIRGAFATLPAWDLRARVGAETLGHLLDLRGLDYACGAIARWADRLPE